MLVAAGLVLLAGCGTAAPAAAGKDLTKYLPNKKQLSDVGVEQKQAPSSFPFGWITPLHVVRACEGDWPWEANLRSGAHATATTGKLLVWQLAAEYESSGEQLLAAVGKALGCGAEAAHDRELGADPRFSAPGVADPQLGFCRRFREIHSSSCVLMLARGHRVLAIRTDSQTVGAPEQQAELKRLAPAFAAVFDRD